MQPLCGNGVLEGTGGDGCCPENCMPETDLECADLVRDVPYALRFSLEPPAQVQWGQLFEPTRLRTLRVWCSTLLPEAYRTFVMIDERPYAH